MSNNRKGVPPEPTVKAHELRGFDSDSLQQGDRVRIRDFIFELEWAETGEGKAGESYLDMCAANRYGACSMIGLLF